MAQMELDVTRIMILLQRKCGAVRELGRLTKELEEAFGRNDEVSVALLLQMRQDELSKIESCMEEIWMMGELDRETYDKVSALVASDPEESVGESKEEQKIFEIRRKTKVLLEELNAIDQKLSQKMAARKSHYKTEVV